MDELIASLKKCNAFVNWGKVIITIQNGKIVLITKEETVKI